MLFLTNFFAFSTYINNNGDIMKKLFVILIFPILLILVSYTLVNSFVREEIIRFKYNQHDEKIKVKRESTGEIKEIYFEDYIVGVLAGEMPVNFELEALKAQAVAARSYALKKMLKNENQEYDVIDTVANQVYQDEEELKKRWGSDYIKNLNKIKSAVLETQGEYIAYNGEVIEAFFFSTSTGKTENSEEVFTSSRPYLKSVDSSWDAKVSPVFQVENDISLNDFYTKLGLPYQEQLQVEVVKQTSTGRMKQVKINGVEMSANDVYQKLGLKSTYFHIEQVGTNVHIETKGYGHGVGMSQYGAEGMAKEGFSYDEIIKHYYQGVEIKKL